MRRFIRSFFVRRRQQVTVVQDGTARQFEIWVWRAADHTLTLERHYPYGPGGADFVRDVAVREAKQMAETEKRRGALQAAADAIVADALMVVCDGWTEPRHARKVLRVGNTDSISHGMCPECELATRTAL